MFINVVTSVNLTNIETLSLRLKVHKGMELNDYKRIEGITTLSCLSEWSALGVSEQLSVNY